MYFRCAFQGRERYVEYLLSLDKSLLEAPDAQHNTPLLIATNRGNCKTVESLIEAGANIHAKNLEGHTALQVN